ncbi:MAG: hypothetical protein OZ921_19305 [Sorangiineae bacterium]|nr:hypothetical protein [Polyangiaceae bacterium]MEB2324672.1 hypothetical protein [Sorangiineae bacterium]
MTTVTRRGFVLGGATLLVACERRASTTPLSHLYGKDWVHGAYAYYAEGYAELERGAKERSFDAYRVLAQKGVDSLRELQAREVPFYVRVSPSGDAFRVERLVPERLTFSAGMSEADRARATRAWERAREHIQTDYVLVSRLDWALGELLGGVARVRSAIDNGRLEAFKLCRQLGELDAGGEPPFALPYQVTVPDYWEIVGLLLVRLEVEREHLERLEAEMVAVGLVARSTDALSASLSDNLAKVLLTVVNDRDAGPPPASADFPDSPDERARLGVVARQVRAKIQASRDYQEWLAREVEREDTLGALFTVVDGLTGLPVSSAYRGVLRLWRGDADYLGYLRLAASLVPSAAGLSKTLETAVEATERYRQVMATAARARALIARAEHEAAAGALTLDGEGLVNVATEHARRFLGKQLVFLRDTAERDEVRGELLASPLGQGPLPALPTEVR